MKLRTCVSPSGCFIFGVHKPHFEVENFRKKDHIDCLGVIEDGRPLMNTNNFPEDRVEETKADAIFEIPNPFPFRGTTFIARSWADAKADDPAAISLPTPPDVSFSESIKKWSDDNGQTKEKIEDIFKYLPEPMLLAIAATSTDSDELVCLAGLCCEFVYDDETKKPSGLKYKTDPKGRIRVVMKNEILFETLANNIFLPGEYKNIMVLKPGVQGGSEIVGDYKNNENNHVFEYLRRNSYIPWGHYAANMANDAMRYRLKDLTIEDMKGMRHLYYQRTYARMGDELGIDMPGKRRPLKIPELEDLRKKIVDCIHSETETSELQFNCSLWGWNFGFDYSPSKYRLHASHQQIHQQFALIPESVPVPNGSDKEVIPAFACGDMIHSFIREYREETGLDFFKTYIRAIRSNSRMDGKPDGDSSLVVFEDDHVMLFVPKAQTSQWELQLMTLGPIGNVLEADQTVRLSLDKGILIAVKVLWELGARMITSIEYAKRFNTKENDQRLLYAFLPKMPESPGAFSEAQLRWINGHYPEDFACACRTKLQSLSL